MPPKKTRSPKTTPSKAQHEVALASVRVVRGDLVQMTKALNRIEKAIQRGKFRQYAVALVELNTMSGYVQDAVRALPVSVGHWAYSLGLDKAQKKGRAR